MPRGQRSKPKSGDNGGCWTGTPFCSRHCGGVHNASSLTPSRGLPMSAWWDDLIDNAPTPNPVRSWSSRTRGGMIIRRHRCGPARGSRPASPTLSRRGADTGTPTGAITAAQRLDVRGDRDHPGHLELGAVSSRTLCAAWPEDRAGPGGPSSDRGQGPCSERQRLQSPPTTAPRQRRAMDATRNDPSHDPDRRWAEHYGDWSPPNRHQRHSRRCWPLLPVPYRYRRSGSVSLSYARARRTPGGSRPGGLRTSPNPPH